MPKNKGKGGKKFKKFKKGNANQRQDFLYKQTNPHYGQQYAKVIKMLGHGRLNAVCEDGITRLCSISGKLKKRKTNGFIVSGDIILICVRPFNNKLADVLYKYSNQDIQQFLQGKVPVSDLFRDMIADVGSSNVGDVEFGYTNDNISDDSSDDLDIGSNNNRQIQYSDVESDDSDIDDIDNIDSYGITKKSNIIDKRIKTKNKRDRRNNWKKNYENSRENDVKIDNL